MRLLKSFSLPKAELGILLVNDSRIKKLNCAFRRIDKTTDVLSFPVYNNIREIPRDRSALIGDIVINLHAATRQSAEYGCTFHDEVQRLLIHGFLHLMGYNHGKNAYQEQKMRKKARELQDAFKKMD